MILTALAMAFITTLVVANIIAIKLFSFSVPIIPDDWLIDNVWVLPVSSFTYPITFLITDTGPRPALSGLASDAASSCSP